MLLNDWTTVALLLTLALAMVAWASQDIIHPQD